MRKLMLLVGVAALAASMPALAEDRERGGGRGRGQAAQVDRGGGGHARAERGGGRDREVRRVDRGRGGRGNAVRADRRLNSQERRVERAIARERRSVRQARMEDRRGDERGRAWRGDDDDRRFDRRGGGRGRGWRGDDDDRRFGRRGDDDDRRFGRRGDDDDDRRFVRRGEWGRYWRGDDDDDDRRFVRRGRFDDRRDWRGWARRPMIVRRFDDDDFDRFRPYQPVGYGYRDCPPGLARHNLYCLPPGQLRRARFIGQRLPIASWPYNVPVRYRYRFVDGDRYFYRYGNDGTVYRFDRATGLTSAVIPIVSNGLFIGEPLPLGYDVYNVPFAYRPFYADTEDHLYRYDDNAIYRVDSDSMLVDGIVALLTGGGGLGGLGVGDLLPTGYDAYNVPFDYRDTYYDTDDSMYRYADGSIYEIDPQTRLIESVISLLV